MTPDCPKPVSESEPVTKLGYVTGWKRLDACSVNGRLRLASSIGGPFGITPEEDTRLWPYRAPYRASCSYRGNHVSPDLLCTCGIYAYKKQEYIGPQSAYHLVKVAMWGKVITHEGGYRAEYAYPLEIIHPATCKGTGCERILGPNYGVPSSVRVEPVTVRIVVPARRTKGSDILPSLDFSFNILGLLGVIMGIILLYLRTPYSKGPWPESFTWVGMAGIYWSVRFAFWLSGYRSRRARKGGR